MSKRYLSYGWVALLLMLLGACANMAQGPTGGKADVVPPKCMGSTPKNGALHVTKNRVEILFDEFLQLSDPAKELTVSPPQKINPSAKAIGKKIVVEMRDSLQPNTTYTFDFGSSIGDYTENNRVNNFLYSFSTGGQLDTLEISGVVLNAATLSPEEGVVVGIYSDETDTLFTTKRFERIGRTNSSGKFTIRGAAGKQYRIFALRDMNNNYFFDQPTEEIAVQEFPLAVPSLTVTERLDTVYGDSLKIDTIITRRESVYAPSDVVLRLFGEKINFQKFNKIERGDRKSFTLFFEKMESSIPQVKLLDTLVENWCRIEANPMADTVKYWLADSALSKMDTIRIAVSYLKTDSAGVLVSAEDTLMAALSSSFLKNEAKELLQWEAKRKKAEKRNRTLPRTNLLTVQPYALVEVYENPTLIWQNPVMSLDADKIHLYKSKDTTKTPLPISVSYDSLRSNCRIYSVKSSALEQDETYSMEIDSACAYDYYGNHNDPIRLNFRVMSESEYAKLTLKLSNVQGDAYVELMNATERVVQRADVKEGVASFIHLKPSTYFARLVVDRNHNGSWDTGKYNEGLLPEWTYYFPKEIRLRPNWEVSEDWDVTANPLPQQRPSGLSAKKKTNKR